MTGSKWQRRPLTFLDGVVYTAIMAWWIAQARPPAWEIAILAAIGLALIWLGEQFLAPLGERSANALADWCGRRRGSGGSKEGGQP